MTRVKTIVGIDLGTTNSLVGVLQAGQPVLLPNALGERLTPSAVAVDDDGSLLVGAAAKARAATHPESAALAFKRDMGTDATLRLGDREMSPVDLSALVLRALVKDAEEALGHPIDEAVITVPAYFGDAQRQATRDAGAIAGLTVERIVNEPTAAALAYGLHHLERELTAVVIDLGGGTFDVTVLEIMEGVIEIRASAGDARLGGEDFTDAILTLLADRARESHGLDADAPKIRARLREAAERAKRQLSEVDRAELLLPSLAGRDVAFDLTRADVERAWAPLLARLRDPIRRALRDARLAPTDVDEVLMVGGASRTPCVVALAVELFGKRPHTELHPDEAVAQGAAIQAGLKAGDEAVDDLVVTDVAPFTMGISSGTKMGTRVVSGLFSPILERGTVIPASRVERFFTLEDGQTQLQVEVFQGEHSLCKDNQKLGEMLVTQLPHRRAGEAWVDVRFTYDLNGILEVEATVMDTGRVSHLVLERRPGKLSATQIERAREAMTRIKFHPRDSLPNRTALARADALYVETSGYERELLGQALGRLRAALETQDAALIDPAREALNALVAQLRSR